MKKCINPFTTKEDYIMNYREAAEHLGMKLSDLHYRYDKRCKLHNDFIPKRRVDYGKSSLIMSSIMTSNQLCHNYFITLHAIC